MSLALPGCPFLPLSPKEPHPRATPVVLLDMAPVYGPPGLSDMAPVYGPVGGPSGPCVRAGILNLVLVHAGDRTASPPFMCAPSRALLVSKLRPVPSQEVLRREHRGAAIAPAGCRQFGKPPTRCLAFAINTKAAGLGHKDEAVMLKLTEPSRDAVAVSANFLLRVSLRQEEAAAHRTRLRAKPATP